MITTRLFFVFILFSFFSNASGFKIAKSVHDSQSLQFLKFEGSGEWDNWLQMNINFEPVAELFKQILIKQRAPLTSRGEAHITVVTPVEFWNVLRPQGMTMSELHRIAEGLQIQQSKFEIVCLGQDEKDIENRLERTYFLVVRSDDLIKIRKQIRQLFLAKGGDTKKFKAENYFPHITVGYTLRDLHESDGVIKDTRTCSSNVVTH